MKQIVMLVFILGCHGLAIAQDNLPLHAEGTVRKRDVPYVTNAHERQKLEIVYFESGPPRGLVVWIHGGAYAKGDKGEAEEIWHGPLQRGHAVASINYRLSGDAKWPAQIADCKAALRYVRANAKRYNVNPDLIAAWGSSAGGHLAALVGATGDTPIFDTGENLEYSSAVSCVVDMFGPVDFEKMPKRSDASSPDGQLWGRANSDALDVARSASPLTYLSKFTPPFLIFHGDADDTIAIEQSIQLHSALQSAGATSEFIQLNGVRHDRLSVWRLEKRSIMNFLDHHLLGENP